MLVPVDLNSCLFTQNEFGNCIYMPEEGGGEEKPASAAHVSEAARKDRRKPPVRSLQSH